MYSPFALKQLYQYLATIGGKLTANSAGKPKLHQQNVFYSLGASRSVWENVECKLRCVNFRRVSDPRRAFWLAFQVPRICDECYWCMMVVIVISLPTPCSTRENFRSTWEHLGVTAISQEELATSLGVPTTCWGAGGSAKGKPGSPSPKQWFHQSSNGSFQTGTIQSSPGAVQEIFGPGLDWSQMLTDQTLTVSRVRVYIPGCSYCNREHICWWSRIDRQK